MPPKPLPGMKRIIWNTKRKNGWERYKSKTDNNEALLNAANLNVDDPEEILRTIDKELDKVKYACFGKVKISSKTKDMKKIDVLQSRKQEITESNKDDKEKLLNEIDKELAQTLKDIEADKHEKDMRELEGLKKSKGKSAAVFGLRDKILGKKKSAQEQVVITDPSTGEDVYTPEEIKRVSLDYCVNLLTQKKPKAKYKERIKGKQIRHQEHMHHCITWFYSLCTIVQ